VTRDGHPVLFHDNLIWTKGSRSQGADEVSTPGEQETGGEVGLPGGRGEVVSKEGTAGS